MGQAARLALARAGEFKPPSQQAQKEIDEHSCKPKSEQYGEDKKRTTAGGVFMVSGCGLFVGLSELYGSESLTQVHLFLHEVFSKHGVELPTVLAYDDGCRE